MTSEPDDLAAARAEIERLEAENESLRSSPTHQRGGWIRPTAVGLLLTLGFLLLPVAGVAVWTRNTLLDTDRYVETVAPLADSEAIQSDVAAAITQAIFEQIDVETLLEENLPPKLSFAAGPLAKQVQSTTNDIVLKAMQSDQFDALWRTVNRQASASVVAFVTGTETSTVLQVKQGQLLLNLEPIVEEVKSRLAAEGIDLADRLPTVRGSVDLPVANVEYLVEARQMANLLQTLAWVLPLASLLCFLGAIALSSRRRRTVVATGLLISGAALLVGLSLGFGRAAYLESMTAVPEVSQESAAVVFDTMVRFLRNGIRVLLLLGLVIALAAAITGPASWAVKVRGGVGGLLTEGGQRSGLSTGPVGAFLHAHRTGYRVVTVSLFALVFIAVDRPTPSTIVWLLVGTLVVLAVLEFLAATAPRPDEHASAEPEPAGAAGPGS